MVVKCSDFLKLSQKLSTASTTEIEYRNVISLSYYSAYHAIKPHLSKNAPKTHSALVDYLCTTSKHKEERIASSDLRSLGLLLDGMKKERVAADYFLDKTFKDDNARKSILSAEAFKKALDEVIGKIPK